MLGVEIIDREGDVAVAVAVLVRLAPALVDRELDLEVVLRVAQVDQREVVEVEAVRDLHTECLVVELDRAPLVEHPHHHVNRLGHGRLLPSPSELFGIANIAGKVERAL